MLFKTFRVRCGLWLLVLGLCSPWIGWAATKIPTAVMIAGENVTTTYGNVTSLHASIAIFNGAPSTVGGGLITFKLGSTVLGTANLDENNTAHLMRRMDVGTYDITASYAGDANNLPSTSAPFTVTVNKALSMPNWVVSPLYTAVGVALPVTITMGGFDPTPPTGTLAISICKYSINRTCLSLSAYTPLTTLTLINGSASFSYTPVFAGEVTFTAAYSGDGRYIPIYGGYLQNVATKATPSVRAYAESSALGVAEPVNITASVYGANASGSVQFKDTFNGTQTTLATCTLVNGTCVGRLSFITAGAHLVNAVYQGDTYNSTASAADPIPITVTTKHIPKLSLAIFPNPVIEGQGVTIVASFQGFISGIVGPASITIKDGTSTVYTGPLSFTAQKGYQVRVAAGAAGTGLHTWTASYPGDLRNSGATSSYIQEVLASGSPPPGLETWNYSYDAENNLTQITDPDGDVTTRNYDGLMRLTSIVKPDPILGGATVGPTITVSQNLRGDTTGIHDGRVQTTYDVDGLGHATAETSADITRIDRVFDDLGRPLAVLPTAPAWPSVNSFDEISRLVRIDYTGGIATQFAYDGSGLNPEAQGQLTHMVDESGTTDYSYSAFGEVTRKTQTAVIAGITKTHAVQYGWGSGAGDSGHLKTLTYPSGSQIEYVYAPDGRVGQIMFHPVLSKGGGPDLSISAASAFMSNVQWTAWGALKSWTTPFGMNAVRTYDTNGRLLSYPLTTSLNRSLKYDLQGRVTVQTTPTLVDRIFAYDALDRLTGMTDTNRYMGYAYDTANNRTLSQVNNLALGTTLVDGTNRLASVEQWGSATTAAGMPLPTVYTQLHDNAGRLTDDGLNRYTYSDRGRLASVRNTSGTTSFLYNGLEQRVAKSGPLGTFFYAYDEAGHVLGEYDATGAPLYEVIWLGDTPVGVIRTAFISTTSTYYTVTDTVFVDHLNTPRTIVNAAGSLVLWTWYTTEDPYAQITPPAIYQTGYVFNLRMPGQVFDKETGLFHNGHRDYNPATGRYIQPDPIGLEGGINRYGYVGGNPVSYTDPLGLAMYRDDFIGPLPRDGYRQSQMVETRCGLVPPAPPGVDIVRNMVAAKDRINPFWFRSMVQNRGPWDYKQQGSIYQDFGNFNYGATGRSFGFYRQILLREAGRAQIAAKTSRPEWGYPPDSRFDIYGGQAPYGDDPDDQVQIENGINFCQCMGQK